MMSLYYEQMTPEANVEGLVSPNELRIVCPIKARERFFLQSMLQVISKNWALQVEGEFSVSNAFDFEDADTLVEFSFAKHQTPISKKNPRHFFHK